MGKIASWMAGLVHRPVMEVSLLIVRLPFTSIRIRLS